MNDKLPGCHKVSIIMCWAIDCIIQSMKMWAKNVRNQSKFSEWFVCISRYLLLYTEIEEIKLDFYF